ncbi:hypothetical protein GTW63_07440, partial [Streptomyces sp. SID6137]|nr:hypothetical protein [Streptomyces sp. SID6137]
AGALGVAGAVALIAGVTGSGSPAESRHREGGRRRHGEREPGRGRDPGPAGPLGDRLGAREIPGARVRRLRPDIPRSD